MNEFDLGELLARALFYAEMGHTGMTWEQLGDLGISEWERKAGRVIEAWWQPDKPIIVLDLAAGEMSWHPARPVETPTPSPTHEEMVERWGVGFGTPYGNALYSWWLHTQREPMVEERSALMAAIDAGLRALGDSSSQPSAPDPPASFKPFYGDE